MPSTVYASEVPTSARHGLGPGKFDAVRLPALAFVTVLVTLLADPAAAGAQTRDRARISEAVEAIAPDALESYRTLLRLPNDAHHPEDMLAVLAWLEEAFRARGFRIERLPMPGSDALLARRAVPGAARTALVYLQADGQPVDPEAWDQESPWEPVLKARGEDGRWEEIPFERAYRPDRDPEWRVFARSAADSKGPVAQFLAAIDLIDAAGEAPTLDLKVIVDTEEEMGSPHLADAVARHRDALAADWLLIFDGPPHVSGRPTLVFGARGIATLTLTTYGPAAPQHSGHYGNWVPNPVFRMAEVLASLKDESGRVRIPGFYEGISLDEETRAVLAAVPDDEPALRERFGIARPERVGRSLQEAVQYPSLNVRGLRAAWVGREARTIIPATATAELDLRLVAESDPERLIGLLRGHIEELGYHLVAGRDPTAAERRAHPKLARLDARVEYAAYRTPLDSELGKWLSAAYRAFDGEAPIRIRTSGGSVPISPFVATLGVPAVMVPTVNPDNNQHSPNENLRLGSFLEGIGRMVAVLSHPLP